MAWEVDDKDSCGVGDDILSDEQHNNAITMTGSLVNERRFMSPKDKSFVSKLTIIDLFVSVKIPYLYAHQKNIAISPFLHKNVVELTEYALNDVAALKCT